MDDELAREVIERAQHRDLLGLSRQPVYGFHNARSGLCFPSYATIAARAGCARSTVAEALKGSLHDLSKIAR